MCYSCELLIKAFNNTIKKARDIEDAAFESQLKEKRNWLLTDIANKNCEAAKILLSQLTDDEIDKDSTVLDGKTWDQILEENFSKREASPFPAPAPGPQRPSPLQNQIEDIEKILHDIETQSEENYMNSDEDDEIIEDSAQQKFKFWNPSHPIQAPTTTPKVEEKPICVHQWIVYEGAGTKPPETICLKCGILKK